MPSRGRTLNPEWEQWLALVGADSLPWNVRRKRIVWRSLDQAPAAQEAPEITWLGHASFRVRWHGLVLLLDPVFAAWIGPCRRRVPVPRCASLTGADTVLISHAHMDHLHHGTLRKLRPKHIVLPEHTERFLGKDGRRTPLSRVRSGEALTFGRLTITPVPAAHGGWRYPWQKGYQAFSYVISDGRCTLFWTGDSAYGPSFSMVGRHYKIDTALLPIGAYAPQWFLRKRHMNPSEAVQAAIDLRAGCVHPYHFGGYRLSAEPWREPFAWFALAAEKREVDWQLIIGYETHHSRHPF